MCVCVWNESFINLIFFTKKNIFLNAFAHNYQIILFKNLLANNFRKEVSLLSISDYGIGSLVGNFYMPDKWVAIDDLVKLVAVLVDTIDNWQGD